jgi:hypothetical protein
MSLSPHLSLQERYEEALKRLAQVLQLDVSEVRRLCGDLATAAGTARKLLDFFGDPEIEAAWNEVIRVSDQYREVHRAKRS